MIDTVELTEFEMLCGVTLADVKVATAGALRSGTSIIFPDGLSPATYSAALRLMGESWAEFRGFNGLGMPVYKSMRNTDD